MNTTELEFPISDKSDERDRLPRKEMLMEIKTLLLSTAYSTLRQDYLFNKR